MTEDQALGAIVGLAVGDALGTTLEFSRNPSPDRSTWHTEMTGGGPFRLRAGGWTDDTSMALALMQAYLDSGRFDPELIGRYFVDWYREGKFSHTGTCFDIGNATREALDRIDLGTRGSSPFQGSTHPHSSGNGGIMRLAPAVVANHTSLQAAIHESVDQSRITHASDECQLYAELMARVLHSGDPFIPEVTKHVLPDDTPWDALLSGGYVKETFTCAMWAARTTDSFEECLIQTINRRYDADTTGAVAGQIAGAMYGLSGIPDRWLETLIWRDRIIENARALYAMGSEAERTRTPAAQRSDLPTQIVRMIQSLHARGYESIYLLSGMSPSGMSWRYEIGIILDGQWPSKHILAIDSLDRERTDTPWSRGELAVQALADAFIAQYHDQLSDAQTPNARFVLWFQQVAQQLHLDPNGLLNFYEDLDPPAHRPYLKNAPGWNGKLSA